MGVMSRGVVRGGFRWWKFGSVMTATGMLAELGNDGTYPGYPRRFEVPDGRCDGQVMGYKCDRKPMAPTSRVAEGTIGKGRYCIHQKLGLWDGTV
jgi:hypothetical protein